MEDKFIRKTKYGLIKGKEDKYCEVYYNIPFAKPPLGELMFKHPIEPDKYEGILDCTKGGVNPFQHYGKFGIPNQSLDCLYAYIFIPKGVKGPLPVMFWIYGGAYSNGGVGIFNENNELYYDMSLFAAETKTVVVTFNYRINIFGFSNLSLLGDKFDFNNGVMDQLLALRFTKENISNFEGDPNNITIMGQSAGAASVLTLMSMEETNGLYNKAIMMSPCVNHYFSVEESEKLTHKLLKLAKIKDPNELYTIDLDKLSKPIEKAINWLLVNKADVRCFFSPIIDGKVLKDYPRNRVNQAKVPLLLSYTSNESDMFIDDYPAILLPFIKWNGKVKLEKNHDTYRHRISDAFTKVQFHDPITSLADSYKYPLHLMEFAHHYDGKRAYHALDVILMVTLKDEEGAKGVRKIFSDFAYTSNPGWEEYKANKRKFILK